MNIPLLECVELETGPGPTWSVVWLHGLGADGHDFQPIVPELVQTGWPALRFVFPHAPVRAVTVMGGARVRAWYDIAHEDLDRRADAAGVDQSIGQVQALIDREIERGIDRNQVLLAGFSQGGAITLALGVRSARPLAGLIALSTYLPAPERALAEAAPAAHGRPVFMAHGRQDPVVPMAMGEASAAVLRRAGLAVDWHAYAMAHSVCAEEITALASWMDARFKARG